MKDRYTSATNSPAAGRGHGTAAAARASQPNLPPAVPIAVPPPISKDQQDINKWTATGTTVYGTWSSEKSANFTKIFTEHHQDASQKLMVAGWITEQANSIIGRADHGRYAAASPINCGIRMQNCTVELFSSQIVQQGNCAATKSHTIGGVQQQSWAVVESHRSGNIQQQSHVTGKPCHSEIGSQKQRDTIEVCRNMDTPAWSRTRCAAASPRSRIPANVQKRDHMFAESHSRFGGLQQPESQIIMASINSRVRRPRNCTAEELRSRTVTHWQTNSLQASCMLDTSFTNGIAWQGLSSSSTIEVQQSHTIPESRSEVAEQRSGSTEKNHAEIGRAHV